MKKMMMILVAVAAIGFTACNKTNTTDEQKAQTEQAEGAKADGKTDDAAAQNTNNAAPTDANADVKANDKAGK